MMMMVGKKVEELIARIAQKSARGRHSYDSGHTTSVGGCDHRPDQGQRANAHCLSGVVKKLTRAPFSTRAALNSCWAMAICCLCRRAVRCLSGCTAPLSMTTKCNRVVAEWKTRGEPDYIEEITQGSEGDGVPGLEAGDEKDDLYDQAVAFVTESGKCSISSVQRKLRIGYNRAARLVETMEASGVVSPPAHNGSREVLARAAPSD